jgi:hypothetical protein
VRKIEASRKMILFEMKVKCRKWIKMLKCLAQIKFTSLAKCQIEKRRFAIDRILKERTFIKRRRAVVIVT